MTAPLTTTHDFDVWAPIPADVVLVLRPAGSSDELTRVPMTVDDEGWWRPDGPLPDFAARGAVDYGYLLDDGEVPRPDPRSRFQPYGVHGLSRSYDHTAYTWHDGHWLGRQLAGGVIYELHVGTFTPEGTLTAAIDRLDHLVELGIDFVELLPVNAFNGEHNWGYDGVLWYAVQHSYGGPDAYQRFVDACHSRGLAVIQDVVYNHLGPSGNYLPEFGPYLVDTASSAWGSGLNLDQDRSDEVREYIIGNALMWLRDYHVDGLRLDAVHALRDSRAVHILEDLAVEVNALSATQGRPMPLIAESDLNDPRLITSREGGGYGLDAQWSDDFHHALYVSLTGDTSGYYADFDSLEALAKVFVNGFFHDGTRSSFRGRRHGHPIDTLRTPTWRLVVCSDNHDQIGNRADGARLSSRLDPRQRAIAAVVTLLSPFTPMVFMGEEWGAHTPWQFFTSHPEPELGEAVARGRVEEFAAMDWDPDVVPDPQDPATFARSHLDWAELDEPTAGDLFDLNRRLLQIRREYPDLIDPRFDRGTASSDDDAGWLLIERGTMVVAINFRDAPTSVNLPFPIDVVTAVGFATADADDQADLGGWSALIGVRR